jgi:SSS family solute:Na+ symporter
MSTTDWLVIILVLTGIILYGLYRSRTSKNLDGYLLSNRNLPWYIILLSIMGTQASAVTFLSGPGQSYTDGMRFVQYYFGLPLAMVVICITFVPLFKRLKVYTAYEFLENRFDHKTRIFTSSLFLLQRGLSTGISIYAPSIIISALFGWDIFWTNLFMGGLLIIYTVSGGARAVAHTQKIQLVIIFIAMFLAAWIIVHSLPLGISFKDALHVGGKMGKLNVITTGRTEHGFNWSDRYNIWSGLIGGFFLALSYFGTDHSQVGRYLTAKSNRESRVGLLLNGLIKVPMQFCILLIGVLVFTFYQFNPAPLSFNDSLLQKTGNSNYKDSINQLQVKLDSVNAAKPALLSVFIQDIHSNKKPSDTIVTQLKNLNQKAETYRSDFRRLAGKGNDRDTNDTNYIFLSFVKNHLPDGLKGLLIAIIFLAAWGSIAAALNSLAASTVVDFHRNSGQEHRSLYDYRLSKWYTFAWGAFSILIAQFSSRLGQSLIEAVNVLGSLFYGVILGIFLVAFYFKKIKGTPVFFAAIVTEIFIVILFFYPAIEQKLNIQFPLFNRLPVISFLWLNVIGALGVIALSAIVQLISNIKAGKPEAV